MNRLLRNKKIILSSFFPALNFDDDEEFEKYKENRGFYIEDPWLRVKSIFLKDEYGAFHPELVNAIGNAQVGACIGGLYGAVIESRKEIDKFVRTNDTNIYANRKELFKMLNNRNIIGIMKGSIKWAPSFAFFLGGFTLFSSCCELYRNKISIIDSTAAGFAVGALCKFSFGMRGMLSGGLVGGVLGTLYGLMLWCSCKVTNVDGIQIKYAQFSFIQHREQQKKHGLTEKDKVFEGLEKSGLYVSHVSNPLNILSEEENELQEPKEIKPNC